MASDLVTELTSSITVPVVNALGQSVGSETIDPKEFGGKINKQLLHDVVLMYRANQRAGTHSTLRRGEVAGSTKKLFRQKGTGNARAGTKRTNKRRGGGTAKGPKRGDAHGHPEQVPGQRGHHRREPRPARRHRRLGPERYQDEGDARRPR